MRCTSPRATLTAIKLLFWGLLLGLNTGDAGAASTPLKVAVAANFTGAFTLLQAAFEEESNHSLSPSFASTGQLYAQIHHGAPFEVFLSADTLRPEQLIQQQLADGASAFVYAQGRLALWSRAGGGPGGYPLDRGQVLTEAYRFQDNRIRLALANPKLAPYGRAAKETLEYLGVYPQFKDRLITAQSISQTMQFVASGNVALGFVALSQLQTLDHIEPEDYWVVPAHMHQPIHQKAVLLKRGYNNPVAREFLTFLRSPQAISIIERYGYSRLPPQ